MMLYDVISYDTTWSMRLDTCDTMWYDMIGYDMIRYDTRWYNVIRYDVRRYDVIRCDTMWYNVKNTCLEEKYPTLYRVWNFKQISCQHWKTWRTRTFLSPHGVLAWSYISYSQEVLLWQSAQFQPPKLGWEWAFVYVSVIKTHFKTTQVLNLTLSYLELHTYTVWHVKAESWICSKFLLFTWLHSFSHSSSGYHYCNLRLSLLHDKHSVFYCPSCSFRES